MKGTRIIVVSALCLAAALNLSATGHAEPIAVRIVPPFDPAEYASRGAVGLMVPGVGGIVTRAGALAALERGKVRHSLLGGIPTGKIDVLPSAHPGTRVTFYVALPPPGDTPNHTRYPVAIVGCGFHGVVTSSATRVPGLISIADIAPAVVHLRAGGCRAAPLGWQASRDAPSQLRSLDHRIHRVAHAQGWMLVAVLVAGCALALARGLAGVAACVGFVIASLILSAFRVEAFWPLLLGVVAIASVFAVAVRKRRFLPVLVALFFAAFLTVLVADSSLNSLAVLGAHLDGGGRFYGVTNQLETLLLAPTLAAAAVDGTGWLVALGLLALVTVGWSRAGADGGGIVVYAAALAVLAVKLRGLALTPRRVFALAAGVVVLAVALVGIDAALGGSSHVTHAVGTGPGSVLGDIGHRLHLSYLTVTSSSGKEIEFGFAMAALVAVAAFARRSPLMQAFLVGIAASFFVNDSPVDVAFLGALGCWALARLESVDSRAMRRSPVVLFAPALLVLGLTGCGSQGTVQPTAQKVVGAIPKAVVSGKQVFAANGCAACHTFKPAGATGTIGPDLDKLAKFAKQAHQPLKSFVQTSIVKPSVYIQKGFPDVMPKTYATLPADQLAALVKFLITKH